jgi:hypothetical protein
MRNVPKLASTVYSKSRGRFSRHTEINSIINRSLTSVHVNSEEPNGLSRDYGKRPDGMTLVPVRHVATDPRAKA